MVIKRFRPGINTMILKNFKLSARAIVKMISVNHLIAKSIISDRTSTKTISSVKFVNYRIKVTPIVDLEPMNYII